MMNGNRHILNDLNKSIEMLEKTATEDIYSEKWKRCVEHVKEQGGDVNAYAVCTASLGDDSFKSFTKSHDLTPEDYARINGELLKDASDKLSDLMKGFSFEEENDAEGEPATSTNAGTLATQTLDMLYGQPPMPRPKMIGGSGDLKKNR